MSETANVQATAVSSETADSSTEAIENTQENQVENEETLEADSSNEGEEQESSEEAKLAKKEAKKEEKKANKKKLKIKVDQKEEDVELDLDNEEELKRQIQLARVAQKRMSEMADLKKDVTDLLTRLNQDPFSVLGDPENGLGLNVDEIVKQYVEKRLQEMEKSPEQLAKEKMEAELKALREEKQRIAQEREKERQEAALQAEIVKYDNMITDALSNSEFKKPTPYLVKKMANYLELGIQNGIDVTPADVLPLVREEIQNEIKELINSAPDEVIEAMFGKEIFNKMRKKNLARAKTIAPTHASSIKDAGEKQQSKEEKQKLTYKQYLKW